MTREELLQLVGEVQAAQSELPDADAKAARGGTPSRLFEPLSAFSNRTGGGVILFGLDEEQDFAVVGVGDPHKLQEDIANVANADMVPALRPEFTVEEVDGKVVVGVEIAEVAAEQKPCYYKPAGLPKGAYIRLGNTNRHMTDYEVFGYVSARSQPTFDEEPVRGATLDDLDHAALEAFVGRLRRTRPRAADFDRPFEGALRP